MSHGGGPLHFIINTCEFLFRSPCFHRVHIHYFLLVDEHYRLLLAWIVAHVRLEPVNNFILAAKQNNRGEVLLALPIILIFCRSNPSKTSVELLIVNNYFEFIDSSGWCFTIVPYLDSTYSFWLVEDKAYIIWNTIVRTLQSLCFLLCCSRGHSLVRPCVLEGSEPHIVLVKGLVFAIEQI